MNKLNISQIMKLAEKLEHTEWISTLIKLNNNNQIEQLLKLIDQTSLLLDVVQTTKNQHTR
ncbi:MAG: hypothetical protein IKN73_00010 [Alphaproteobacteria bacterium]|nr:hypothetical protein [Alphaproteobacteria bacterium]